MRVESQDLKAGGEDRSHSRAPPKFTPLSHTPFVFLPAQSCGERLPHLVSQVLRIGPTSMDVSCLGIFTDALFLHHECPPTVLPLDSYTLL